MRTFRITLSHGGESITFDGAGARSGSMFHVRRDTIEGLWSSPASKVSITERETANGASPISDGETLYAARTVVIPFAIQSNYNHTDLIRARILLGRLIGWHDVRMDINDDGDETVLFGYIEAKYSDIPYDHADTGTITLVCPDPRRVSKNASNVTVNTSSSSVGGLSFGTPACELAWTGTANASTSTLSQDGAVVATNVFNNPKLITSLVSTVVGCSIANDSDGNLVITSTKEGVSTIYCIFPITSGDYVMTFRCLSTDTPEYDNTLRVYDLTHSWATVKFVTANIGSATVVPFTVPDGCVSVCVQLRTGTAVGNVSTWSPNGGVYSAADWSAMQDIGVDWFDGDSQSPQPNAGLAFPINFGQTGNTGNTGMMVNNGSYLSTPVITAHGGLNSGLTIHWNTSDGNEGDLSYNGSIQNVPVTINTDTHSAIMGGLDVSYQLGSRDWPRIPAGGSCSFALLASGGGWVTVQSHDTYM